MYSEQGLGMYGQGFVTMLRSCMWQAVHEMMC